MTFNYLNYLHPDEYSKELVSGEKHVDAYYQKKAETANYLSPKVIFEVGVRVGYSAAAFLFSNPTGTYIGLDSFLEGGFKDQERYVNQFLTTSFPKATINIIEGNSQNTIMRESILNKWRDVVDFIHIDGNHSYEGCYTDLWFGFRLSKNGGHIMVDDYLNPKFKNSVALAVDEFVKTTNLDMKIIESWRGDALIKVIKS